MECWSSFGLRSTVSVWSVAMWQLPRHLSFLLSLCCVLLSEMHHRMLYHVRWAFCSCQSFA